MKLTNLKTGMWVKTRNKGMYLVLKDYETEYYGKGAIYNEEGFKPFESYDNNMRYIGDKNYDIVEVLKTRLDCHVLSQIDLIPIWKEESIKLTPLEMEFFKALGPAYKSGWIAKDENEDVWIYDSKPVKGFGEWDSGEHVEGINFIYNIFAEKVFKWLSWEDDEPCYIPDLIKRCNI